MMRAFERTGLQMLSLLDAERAHAAALLTIRAGLLPRPGPVTSDRLRTRIGRLELPNPVGIAAGFDKNATAVNGLSQSGFGFLEVGAATPLPQPGNPKPRLFRLYEDNAAINRFGFNNDGVERITERLAKAKPAVPVGLNLGANKDSPDRQGDFVKVLKHAGPHIDFATVNVSSPNTERLRDLQGPQALAILLESVMRAQSNVPVYLKIAPDLSDAELADVAAVAENAGVAGIVATNTTLARDGLHSANAREKGGLSGRPLFDPSTRVLAHLSRLTKVPLIGVGGVASGSDALTKIRAGACAVQLYTAIAYHGLSLGTRICEELDDLMRINGFNSIREAIGTDVRSWL